MSSLRETYVALWQKYVTRPGTDDFLKWLDATDFFTAPCSTQYHLAREGGLVLHSLNVFTCLKQQVARFRQANHPDLQMTDEELMEIIAILALGHDVCKADFYTVEMRNNKNEKTGQWEKVPFFKVKDQFPYGHGEKSVLLLSRFFQLEDFEAMAIRFHMGGWTSSDYDLKQAVSAASSKSIWVPLLQMADMEATYIREREESK